MANPKNRETHQIFENDESDEEEENEEDLKLGISNEGENGVDRPSEGRWIPV